MPRNCFAFLAEKYKYFDTRLDSLSLFESGLVKYLLTFSMLKIESLFDIKNIMVSIPCAALCILSIKVVEIGYATYSSELDTYIHAFLTI